MEAGLKIGWVGTAAGGGVNIGAVADVDGPPLKILRMKKIIGLVLEVVILCLDHFQIYLLMDRSCLLLNLLAYLFASLCLQKCLPMDHFHQLDYPQLFVLLQLSLSTFYQFFRSSSSLSSYFNALPDASTNMFSLPWNSIGSNISAL
jgi:hypothetical protein